MKKVYTFLAVLGPLSSYPTAAVEVEVPPKEAVEVVVGLLSENAKLYNQLVDAAYNLKKGKDLLDYAVALDAASKANETLPLPPPQTAGTSDILKRYRELTELVNSVKLPPEEDAATPKSPTIVELSSQNNIERRAAHHQLVTYSLTLQERLIEAQKLVQAVSDLRDQAKETKAAAVLLSTNFFETAKTVFFPKLQETFGFAWLDMETQLVPAVSELARVTAEKATALAEELPGRVERAENSTGNVQLLLEREEASLIEELAQLEAREANLETKRQDLAAKSQQYDDRFTLHESDCGGWLWFVKRAAVLLDNHLERKGVGFYRQQTDEISTQVYSILTSRLELSGTAVESLQRATNFIAAEEFEKHPVFIALQKHVQEIASIYQGYEEVSEAIVSEYNVQATEYSDRRDATHAQSEALESAKLDYEIKRQSLERLIVQFNAVVFKGCPAGNSFNDCTHEDLKSTFLRLRQEESSRIDSLNAELKQFHAEIKRQEADIEAQTQATNALRRSMREGMWPGFYLMYGISVRYMELLSETIECEKSRHVLEQLLKQNQADSAAFTIVAK